MLREHKVIPIIPSPVHSEGNKTISLERLRRSMIDLQQDFRRLGQFVGHVDPIGSLRGFQWDKILAFDFKTAEENNLQGSRGKDGSINSKSLFEMAIGINRGFKRWMHNDSPAWGENIPYAQAFLQTVQMELLTRGMAAGFVTPQELDQAVRQSAQDLLPEGKERLILQVRLHTTDGSEIIHYVPVSSENEALVLQQSSNLPKAASLFDSVVPLRITRTGESIVINPIPGTSSLSSEDVTTLRLWARIAAIADTDDAEQERLMQQQTTIASPSLVSPDVAPMVGKDAFEAIPILSRDELPGTQEVELSPELRGIIDRLGVLLVNLINDVNYNSNNIGKGVVYPISDGIMLQSGKSPWDRKLDIIINGQRLIRGHDFRLDDIRESQRLLAEVLANVVRTEGTGKLKLAVMQLTYALFEQMFGVTQEKPQRNQDHSWPSDISGEIHELLGQIEGDPPVIINSPNDAVVFMFYKNPITWIYYPIKLFVKGEYLAHASLSEIYEESTRYFDIVSKEWFHNYPHLPGSFKGIVRSISLDLTVPSITFVSNETSQSQTHVLQPGTGKTNLILSNVS